MVDTYFDQSMKYLPIKFLYSGHPVMGMDAHRLSANCGSQVGTTEFH